MKPIHTVLAVALMSVLAAGQLAHADDPELDIRSTVRAKIAHEEAKQATLTAAEKNADKKPGSDSDSACDIQIALIAAPSGLY